MLFAKRSSTGRKIIRTRFGCSLQSGSPSARPGTSYVVPARYAEAWSAFVARWSRESNTGSAPKPVVWSSSPVPGRRNWIRYESKPCDRPRILIAQNLFFCLSSLKGICCCFCLWVEAWGFSPTKETTSESGLQPLGLSPRRVHNFHTLAHYVFTFSPQANHKKTPGETLGFSHPRPVNHLELHTYGNSEKRGFCTQKNFWWNIGKFASSPHKPFRTLRLRRLHQKQSISCHF